MGNSKIVSLDVGGTLIRLENEGFCSDFRRKTGFSREQLRPLFFEHFLTKDQPLAQAVNTVCDLIGYHDGQKLVEEFKPAAAFLYEDTIPALKKIAQSGMKMVATSNCTPWEAGGLESLGLSLYLSRIFYSYAIGFAKPDRGIFKYVEQKLHVRPEQMIHVGDSWNADIEGAISAGWEAVFLCRDREISVPHDERIKVIRSLEELPEIVCNRI